MQKSSYLPDHIQPGVQILFVGINPGLRSAEVGHHFAGYSNRFWKLLYDARLVPVPVTYKDDWRLPDWGYGLSNIVERPTSGSHELTTSDYVEGRKKFLRKVRRYQPKVIALLGVTLTPILLPVMSKTRKQDYKNGQRVHVGLQSEQFGGSHVFVLPNPSGRNAHYSYTDMLALFRQLRRLLLNQIGSQV